MQVQVQVQALECRCRCAGAGVQLQEHDLADGISKVAADFAIQEHPTDIPELPLAKDYRRVDARSRGNHLVH